MTNEIGLDKSKLWVTVFETDDESFEIWKNDVGVPAERILRKGKKDNFWGPPGPTGPCGPCTEIHYDLGEEYKCDHPQCGIDTCECDRYVEIWNLVFMELNKDEEGNFTPLEKKNVDTGMGLERITMVVNGLTSTFDTDLLQPIVKKVCELSGKKYKDNKKDDVSIRIITDHARCVSFLISDGLIPGNEGRNYVLRMILRRALRHGKILGVELPFLYKIVDTVVENYKDTYPELEKNKEAINKTIAEDFIKILAPFAPHITEELWRQFGNQESVHLAAWPEYDVQAITEAEIELVVQINGVVRDKVVIGRSLDQSAAEAIVLNLEKIKAALSGKKPKKVIFVPGRLINLVV